MSTGREPILLSGFQHMKVRNLSEALETVKSGKALICTLQKPYSTLYIGNIPKSIAVLWHYPKNETLYVTNGCTYFTWNHAVEVVVATGIMTHIMRLGSVDVIISFHIFDPIKFCSGIPIDEIYDKLHREISKLMADHLDDSFESAEFLAYQSSMYFKLNRTFRTFGFSITRLQPCVHFNTNQ